MKRVFALLLLIIVLNYSLMGQELSSEGRMHWKAAELLYKTINNESDYIGVIKELKSVARSDPDFADTYFNLGEIYAKRNDFRYASVFFNRFKELVPDEADAIDKLLYKERIRFYRNPVVEKLVGTWKDDLENPTVSITIGVYDSSISLFIQAEGMTERLSISGHYPDPLHNDQVRCGPTGGICFSGSEVWEVIGTRGSGHGADYYKEYPIDLYKWCSFLEFFSGGISFLDSSSVVTDYYIEGIESQCEDQLLLSGFVYKRYQPISKKVKKGLKTTEEYEWELLSRVRIPEIVLMKVNEQLPSLSSLL